MKAIRSPKIERAILGGVVLLSIVVHGLFIIHGFGEPDAARLAVAAEEWHLAGRTLYQSYVFRTSPMYIHGIKLLLDAGLSPAALPAALNLLAVVLGSLTMIPLYFLWKKLANPATAAVALALFALTPAYWMANVYGMAHLPAFSFFVLALTLFVYGLTGSERTRTRWFLGAVLFGIVGVAFKADMILCYGAFLGAVFALHKVQRWFVIWALTIPVLALLEVTFYTRSLAPSLGGITGFAGAWSSNFPFTLDAVIDSKNRAVLVNSLGSVLAVIVVLAMVDAFRAKHLRAYLIVLGSWALPPLLFWGLKMGNSARHMMAAVAAMTFLVAVVLTTRIRSRSILAAAAALILILNYVLAPAEGGSVSPTARLHQFNRTVQRYVDNLHLGGQAFATFPVPSKMFVGGPAAPYALHEVMKRSQEIHSYENDEPSTPMEIEFAEKWPRYVATYSEGVVYVVGFMQVTGPYKMPEMEDWFGFTIEPGILTRNRMTKWRPYITDAVRQNPESFNEWAIFAGLKVEAGLAFIEIDELAKALAIFEDALASRPKYPDAMWNVAMLYSYYKRLDEAWPLLEEFMKLYPQDPRSEYAKEIMAKLKKGQ